MASEDRRAHVMNLLETKASVTVTELSEAFGISEVTVRKLLAAMEQEGTVKRTWGGAVSACGSLREYSHKEKEPKMLEEKQSIAQAAYDCIQDGDAVFLDCGTTTVQLARLIRNGPKRNLMVGTNAVNIAMELADAEDIPIVVVGGEFRHRIFSCVGTLAEEALRSMYFDKGFISGNHLTVEHGFTTPNLQEVRVKRLMMEFCKEPYIVLDHGKFGDDSLCLVRPANEIYGVITDWQTPAEIINSLRDRGVKVLQGIDPKQK